MPPLAELERALEARRGGREMPALTDARVDAPKSAHASPSPCAPDSLSRFVVRKKRIGPAVLALVMR